MFLILNNTKNLQFKKNIEIWALSEDFQVKDFIELIWLIQQEREYVDFFIII